jgi:hypothetical protein
VTGVQTCALPISDLITSVLLFSQFAIYRLRALLVLACGYLIALRRKRRMRVAIQRAEPPARQQALRPRSSRAASGQVGLAASGERADAAQP